MNIVSTRPIWWTLIKACCCLRHFIIRCNDSTIIQAIIILASTIHILAIISSLPLLLHRNRHHPYNNRHLKHYHHARRNHNTDKIYQSSSLSLTDTSGNHNPATIFPPRRCHLSCRMTQVVKRGPELRKPTRAPSPLVESLDTSGVVILVGLLWCWITYHHCCY